jgi:hypothetical protein
MSEFFFRTEDIKDEEILRYFVETAEDRKIVDALKSRNPTIVIGSRGAGKSFLLRVAEAELLATFGTQRVFPVYLSFTKGSLIHTSNRAQFQDWMLARICARTVRGLTKAGLLVTSPTSFSILSGGSARMDIATKTRIETIAEEFERSWQNPGMSVDTSGLPTIEKLKDAIEDLCTNLGIARFAILVDEAAHIFSPAQQREFFTLFRDLRSPYITCNAAVYPGVTAFGDTFQPIHDATLMPLDRDVLSSSYVANMREIVEKQADSTLLASIARNGQNFASLAFAATGNPRVLLKTLNRASKVNNQEVNEVIREYYRADIWAEHSLLAEKYSGHRAIIDWGRHFIETEVLPELQRKNSQYLQSDKNTTSFFWVHRDTPEVVKQSLRLLAYTGVVREHASGIKATRSEIGTRYLVNLGCLFALESAPAATSFPIASNLAPKRMSEYGANYPAYQGLLKEAPSFREPDIDELLRTQLVKSVDVLDITPWQRGRLIELGLPTLGDVLRATETKLQEAYYVGEVRSRRMRNAAIAAVYEYLSG